MDRSQIRRSQVNRFRPQAEPIEDRLLMTLAGVITGALGPQGFLFNPAGVQAIRPNTPVLPFASTLAKATFIDPAAHLIHGNHIVIGTQTYVAPYATLDATTGYIKIGSQSDILDNATIASNPTNITQYPPNVEIGDQVSISFGATVDGPSIIGAYGSTKAKPTGIGPNAVIDGATIEPGAVVGALARVGPGVTVPSGMYVIPGSNVTTNAEASDPALGKVEPIPANVLTALKTAIARYPALAAGYTNLYQGNSATGANPGTTTSGINNGNLSTVEGASPEPGASTSSATTGIAFEPTASTEPSFIGPFKPSVMASLFNFTARVIGAVQFNARAQVVQENLGRSNSIRGDQGQPISFASAPVTGRGVTITSPGGGVMITTMMETNFGVTSTKTTTTTTGTMKIGKNLHLGDQAVLLGGTKPSYSIGNDVTIGAGAVVSDSMIGAGASIGSRAYVSGSTIAKGQVVPDGEILINNKVVGQIQW